MSELDDKLNNLEKKAKAARSGPLSIERRDVDCGYITYVVHSGKGDYAWCSDELDAKAKRNAELVAAMDKETVLELIAEVRQYRRLESALEHLSCCISNFPVHPGRALIDLAKQHGWEEHDGKEE